MNYAQNNPSALSQYQGQEAASNRPTTDLEDIQKRFYHALSEAQSLANRLSLVVAKLRGPSPPSGEKPSQPHAVANGMIDELRQAAADLVAAHEASASLLEMIEAAV